MGELTSFQFYEKLQKESATNSFCLSIFDVLLELVLPIIQRDDLLAKIDFTIMDKIDVEFDLKDLTLFAEPKLLEELQAHKKQSNSNQTALILASVNF